MSDAIDLAEALARHLASADMDCLDLRGPGCTLRLVRRGRSFVAAPAEAGDHDTDRQIIRADRPGVFLVRHPMRTTPLAPVGAPVAAGAILGFLRVGPVLSPVTAPRAGVVTAILAEAERATGFGAPLFEIALSESEDRT